MPKLRRLSEAVQSLEELKAFALFAETVRILYVDLIFKGAVKERVYCIKLCCFKVKGGDDSAKEAKGFGG